MVTDAFSYPTRIRPWIHDYASNCLNIKQRALLSLLRHDIFERSSLHQLIKIFIHEASFSNENCPLLAIPPTKGERKPGKFEVFLGRLFIPYASGKMRWSRQEPRLTISKHIFRREDGEDETYACPSPTHQPLIMIRIPSNLFLHVPCLLSRSTGPELMHFYVEF